MPVVTKEQALELLTKEVQEKLGVDELVEVYNEAFPDHPYTEAAAHQDTTPLIEQLVELIHREQGVDEVMDLWGLIIPKTRNIWYDEEEDRIHFNEETEAISAD